MSADRKIQRNYRRTQTRLQDAEDRTIAIAVHQAIVSSVRLELLPKATIDVFVTVIEADGIEGVIASASIAVSAALADSGIEILGLVVSCSAVRNVYATNGFHGS